MISVTRHQDTIRYQRFPTRDNFSKAGISGFPEKWDNIPAQSSCWNINRLADLAELIPIAV